MKSAHRHELETNVLAQRLDVFIERAKPYAATAAGIVVALVVIMFVWSYVSGSSASRQGEAWDAYHRGVASVPPNLDQLRRSAEEYPGTKMQQLADVTWADGQVWTAARDYIYNRDAAMEALRRATSAYQGILQTSRDERLLTRAHLGMARIYEMQNQLEKAREEYLKVGGGYEEFAKEQIKRLDDPDAGETYKWLATAQPPRTRPPAGPGTPGQQPEFSAGEFALPGTESTDDAATGTGESFDNLLKGFDLGFPKGEGADRYPAGEEPPATTTEGAAPATGAVPNASNAEGKAPATDETPAE
jgi:hypothetical protein